MLNRHNLNLARKWRPATFDDVIGQDLAIKILRNSIYLNHFFPVYLFSGHRGCGKTSTARIFASAANCFKLSDFQKDPKSTTLPCMECDSCVAMSLQKHPDFIEIDAASHTGVENIRQIIESSSFLPVLASRKIYLIDEAHMLSRAAFNAFLKLLEEPPASVIFILATTEPDKILDTVRSRSFQLFFNFVEQGSLYKSLKNICDKEGILYEEDALLVITRESEGSVRDAQNLLERVRFSADKVTKSVVYDVLGFPSQEVLLDLVVKILKKVDTQELISYFNSINFYNLSAELVYEKILLLIRDMIYHKNGVSIEGLAGFETDMPLESFLGLLEFLNSHEDVFLKVSNKLVYLEMLLISFTIKKKN